MVGLVADLPAEVPKRVHMSADLADFGGQELVVPDGPAAPAFGAARRPAGHAQPEDPAGRQRDAGVVFVPEPDNLGGLDQRESLLHLGGPEEIGIAALVVGAPAGRIPVPPERGAGVGVARAVVVGSHGCDPL